MLILSSVAKLLGAAILFPNNSKNDEGTLNTLMNVANKLFPRVTRILRIYEEFVLNSKILISRI